jgi:hypothetical protein
MPEAFSSSAKAEAAFAAAMRDEWETHKPADAETGEPMSIPEDPRIAHEILIEQLGAEWGQWEVFCCEIREGDPNESVCRQIRASAWGGYPHLQDQRNGMGMAPIYCG